MTNLALRNAMNIKQNIGNKNAPKWRQVVDNRRKDYNGAIRWTSSLIKRPIICIMLIKIKLIFIIYLITNIYRILMKIKSNLFISNFNFEVGDMTKFLKKTFSVSSSSKKLYYSFYRTNLTAIYDDSFLFLDEKGRGSV